jgi:hypothetical protein
MVAMRLRPLIPASRLETLGFKSRRLPQHVAELSKAAWRMPSWRRLSIGIPVAAVALAVYLTSDRSNVSLARADTSVISDVVGEVRRDLAGRAAVDLNETFGAGLNQWNGAEKWQTSWSAHTGEALPGKLALYTPSVSLRDYNAEFNGQIAKKALSFVVRARDLDNYLAVRFVAVTPGLMPEVVVERYAVVAGEMSQPVRTQLHMPLAQDSVYLVRIDARGSDFTVYLNGTVADHWTDARFPTGGIGFFTKKGEKARITGLHVWHQDDTVGRLLAKISRDGEKAP